MATQTLPVTERLRRIRSRVETTPGLLRAGLAATWVLALLFFLMVWAGIGQHQKALNTVSYEATTSIRAAQQIKAWLADMHSDAANELLDQRGENRQAREDYEKHRLAATANLVAAAKNITYPQEEDLIKRLLSQLGPYEEAIAQARLLRRRGDEAGYLEAYRRAGLIMYQQGEEVPDKGLLAAADELDQVNNRQLESRYTAEQRSSGWVLGMAVLFGLVLLGMLAAIQVFLYRRMHRVFNPALLGATALTAGFLICTAGSFVAVGHALKGAKEDAFDSVHFLWRARADAYDANGEESRWLLDRDPAQRAAYEKAFREKAGRLVTLPAGTSHAQLVAAARRGDKLPTDFKGHLANELKNITFAGEREAATDMLARFGEYLAIDGEIRKLENDNKHDEAVRLCTGYSEGESNWAFQRFDDALDKTLQKKEDAFQRYIKQGEAALAGSETRAVIVAAVVLLAVAVLTYVGLRPRLLEYAA